MRVKYGCFLVAFILCLYSFSYAQIRPSAVSGSVFLPDNVTAQAATVVLLNQPDSSVAASALVSGNGTYNFLNLKPGKYVLLATRLGYQRTFSKNFELAPGQVLTLSPVILTAANTELKGVTITANRPFVETRPGKVIINPQASITADGKSALEILKQSPGIKVDNSDNVSISGRQGTLILIDGKTTNLTGAELTNLLRSTQGTTIDRIEIIRAGSARYDAASGGIINIVLKKGKNVGTNGVFTAMVGYGKYYKTNTGILFNSRDKNINFFGNYNFEARKTYRNIFTDRNITNAGLLSNYNSSYYTDQKFINHTFKIGADYNISANHTIGFVINGTASDVNIDKHNNLNITNQGNLDSVIRATSTIDRELDNVNYNINYNGKLSAAGDNIVASLNYTPINRRNDEYISNNFFNAAGDQYREPLLLQNLSPSHRNNFTALLDYGKPFSKAGKLEAGLKYSRTKSDNNFVFGPLVGTTYTVSPLLSSEFSYTENVGAGYLNYKNTFGKYDLEAGLRGEYTKSEGLFITYNQVLDRKYFNLFPSLLLNYRRNDKNQFNVTFTRGITRPEYERLNPFFTFIDLYNYQAGNPTLKPSYANTLSFGHIYNDRISSSIYASLSTDVILPFYTQNAVNKIAVLNFRNLGTTTAIGVTFNIPVTITSWWASNYDLIASYQRYKAYPGNGNLNQKTGDMLVSGTQSFAINKVLSAEVYGSYETPNAYGVNYFKAQYTVDAGLKAKILAKRGSLGLNVSDIFNTLRDRYATDYQGLDLRQTDKRESRIIRLNFSYRFGKTTLTPTENRKTGNESEQLRMK